MTAENAPGSIVRPDDDELSLEQLAHQQGVAPVQSVHDMARPALFDSDDELAEFLADVRAARRADVA